MSRRLLAINPVDHPGGAETTLMRLLAGLSSRAWSIALTTPGPGPLREQALSAGYDWRALALGGLGRRRGARAIASWPSARRLSRPVDVVYLNGAVSGRVLPALALRRPRRPRLVLHLHDIVDRVPRFWSLADLVLTASQAVADRLPGLRPEVVHVPVDPDPPAALAPWPPGPGPVVGFVGRIEERKGLLDLVRAAPLIRRGAAGARIVLIGDEPPYAPSPAYTRAVLGSGEVEHHPWSDNAPGLMRHLDVLVLPSRREPFGTVLAEAMSVGTPVVATCVDGLPEVVADGLTGRLVSPGDPAGLAAAVLDVLAHREAMGRAAAQHARRFHTPAYLDRVERLIAP
ncbi:MAG: glycosyltransferase family 4 protein [Solirubrobacteraceae bacterium]